VETDPTAGLLAPAPTTGNVPALDGFSSVAADAADLADEPTGTPLEMAGQRLPGWSADGHTDASGTGPATLTTEWFTLTDALRSGSAPLVVTLAGDAGAGVQVVAQFGTLTGATVRSGRRVDVQDPGGGPTARDARLIVPAGEAAPDVVRLVVEDGGDPFTEPVSVSVPRAPITTEFSAVVPATQPALVDWPVAAVFPCQELGVQAGGLTDVPGWRIAAARPSDAGDIIVAGFVGGPYAEARSLVDQVEYPVYLDARPLERPVTLYRWTPRVDLTAPVERTSEQTVSSWSR
jgi:arabinosyltransferase A/arabinosyltransferase B/arabinosyltransferase C